MAKDFIPGPDDEFNGWQANFLAYALAHGPELNLSPAQLAELSAMAGEWDDDFHAHGVQQSAAAAQRLKKDASRRRYEKKMRVLTALVQADPQTTNAQRASLGVTVPGQRPPAPATPVSRPIVSVHAPQSLTHVVSWVDEDTPTSKARPAGVDYAQLWLYVGATPPHGPSAFRMIAVSRRSPFTHEFDEADAGTMAYWLVRWVSTKGNHGPWSLMVSATVGG